MSSRLPVILASSILLGACAASTARTQPIVVGPAAGREPEQLLASVLAATRRAGYSPLEIDHVRGELHVLARAPGLGRQPVLLVVQIYRDGWARVIPTGPGARRDATHIVLPAEVVQEHHRFGAALAEAFGTEVTR